MMRLIRSVGEYANLYRDDRTGIALVSDGSTGLLNSVHPNIDKTGSVRGMKQLGYWGKADKTVRCGGYIYNISKFVCDDEYDRIVADECMCECCKQRRRKEKNMNNKITINLSGASDNVKEWFKQMLEDEIDDIKGTIENEELWIKGARDAEESALFEENKKEHEEYLEYLKDAWKQLGE